jgi:hypothetical protein
MTPCRHACAPLATRVAAPAGVCQVEMGVPMIGKRVRVLREAGRDM